MLIFLIRRIGGKSDVKLFDILHNLKSLLLVPENINTKMWSVSNSITEKSTIKMKKKLELLIY